MVAIITAATFLTGMPAIIIFTRQRVNLQAAASGHGYNAVSVLLVHCSPIPPINPPLVYRP